MKKQVIVVFLFGLLFISLISAQDHTQRCTISLFPKSENKLAEYLTGKNEVLLINEFMVFSFDADKRSIENCLIYLNTKIQVELNNILNIETTCTSEGVPFVPKTVEINNDGTSSIIDVPGTNFRMVYDPTHPDAIKSGKNKGYVQYPGINKAVEIENLHNTINLYNIFADVYMDMFSGCCVKKESFDSYMLLLSLK